VEKTSGSSIMTMRQLMHRYCFMALWPTRAHLGFLSHPAHQTWLRQTFSYFQTEIHFERATILDDSRDYRKFADGATSHTEKGAPRPFPEVATALGAVHQCRKGVI
jgi:hypothetical protein